ncbi:acyltransferase family protein [Nostoc sp. UHCC 0870]|uniref:acyltransferase family protein n=1 Tax=Nostoc sp. UHCC 0870 TaxID=2914041 RepID=UPI001EDF3E3A|nr:acyltransferase [Nostoc sp. UHCC 0870]UKO99571.1 acyltransferase [Nostoc sp. UHCC 0870]
MEEKFLAESLQSLTSNPNPIDNKKTKPKFYIPSLDGMRTAAFFIVFLAHAGLGHFIPGGLGVTILFFMSGYLITTLLRKEYEKYQTINFKSFYFRRVLRIWPAYYFVLLLGAGLTIFGWLEGEIHLPAFLSQVLHYNNYYSIFIGSGMTDGSNVFWSLAVEEHFYLIFPLLYIFLRKKNLSSQQQMFVFGGLCLATLVWRCILVYALGVTDIRTYYASDTRLDSILFGSILAVHGNPVMDRESYSQTVWKYFFLPGGIVLILFSLLYRSPEFQETFRYTIQGIGIYPIFVTAIRFPNWGLFQLLNLNWIRLLGILTYSLYLVHHTVIYAVQDYLPQFNKLIQGAVSLLISLVLAYAIYLLVENPLIQVRKKFSRS